MSALSQGSRDITSYYTRLKMLQNKLSTYTYLHLWKLYIQCVEGLDRISTTRNYSSILNGIEWVLCRDRFWWWIHFYPSQRSSTLSYKRKCNIQWAVCLLSLKPWHAQWWMFNWIHQSLQLSLVEEARKNNQYILIVVRWNTLLINATSYMDILRGYNHVQSKIHPCQIKVQDNTNSNLARNMICLAMWTLRRWYQQQQPCWLNNCSKL